MVSLGLYINIYLYNVILIKWINLYADDTAGRYCLPERAKANEGTFLLIYHILF